MTELTLQDAFRRAEAGMARAAELGVDMNIAIVDAGGHLLHFVRMDRAWLGSIDIALKKARTAVLFRMPTAVIGGLSQPGGPCYGIELTNDGLVSFGGGLPITDGEGRTIGAIGVSGGTVEQDTLIAEACLATP
ncbi:GlcG/HbpS family heme-binding protein [Bailinhaonella thermotolerans]|uniref:Heme-binding protein n=1 Tax=Bailinhaonella thermotolerans TaxID=1070861 RepID=A0A3A4BWE1_9ACTN|nr:heme-binding protein [Bailinhaonella thermotolerans]RJL35908.1 heme-binding protein [Bailinhaonella thermotolerans]